MKLWEIEGKDRNGKPLLWWAVEGAFGGKYEVIAEFDGTFGKILTLDTHSASGYLIAKIPNIMRDWPTETIRNNIRQFLHELNQTFRYSHHPLVSRHVGLSIACGLPVVLSRKRDLTLRDLIEAGPVKPLQAAQIVAQLAHGLAYCSAKGLTAHQDLKAENILVDRLADQLATPNGFRYPLDHRALVCDFGLANAFSVFGKRTGSRPYMAPEQFGGTESLAKVDIFALGIILHELLTGGLHPISEITWDVWPIPLPTKPNKWKHEDIWKNWARKPKALDPLRIGCPELTEVIKRCLEPNLAQRSSAVTLKTELLDYVGSQSQSTYETLILVLSYFDELASSDEVGGWPYYEDLLERVNSYNYS